MSTADRAVAWAMLQSARLGGAAPGHVLSNDIMQMIGRKIPLSIPEAYDRLVEMFFAENALDIGIRRFESCEMNLVHKLHFLQITSHPIMAPHLQRFPCVLYMRREYAFSRYEIVLAWGPTELDKMINDPTMEELQEWFEKIIAKLQHSINIHYAMTQIVDALTSPGTLRQHPDWVLQDLDPTEFSMFNKRTGQFLNIEYGVYSNIAMRSMGFPKDYEKITIRTRSEAPIATNICHLSTVDLRNLIQKYTLLMDTDSIKVLTESHLYEWMQARFPCWNIERTVGADGGCTKILALTPQEPHSNDHSRPVVEIVVEQNTIYTVLAHSVHYILKMNSAEEIRSKLKPALQQAYHEYIERMQQ